MAVFPRWLDNPYLGLLSRELTERGFHVSFGERFDLRWLWRARRRVDVIHFHWPEGYYVCGRLGKAARLLSWITVALFGARLVVARVFGCRIVWTIHQLYPHDPGRKLLHTVAAGLLARASGLLLVHDRATAEVARRKLGRSVEGKLKVIPHGSYVGVYPPGRPRQAVRDELGIPADAFVFLAFGSVRRYKGLNLLLESFAALPGGNSFLLVAGEPKDERVAAEVGAAARKDSRIRPFLQFVPDERVAELFEASDVAVLPRSDGGTSGALILSLSMGLPAIAARKPAYQELIGDDEAGWLYREGDPASLRSRLAAAAGDRSALLAKGAAARGVVERLSWSEIGGRTAEAILALGDRERRRGGRPRAAERLVRDG